MWVIFHTAERASAPRLSISKGMDEVRNSRTTAQVVDRLSDLLTLMSILLRFAGSMAMRECRRRGQASKLEEEGGTPGQIL